jgi:hypothetical protein
VGKRKGKWGGSRSSRDLPAQCDAIPVRWYSRGHFWHEKNIFGDRGFIILANDRKLIQLYFMHHLNNV